MFKSIKKFIYTQSFFSLLSGIMIVIIIMSVSFFLGFLLNKLFEIAERGEVFILESPPGAAQFDIEGFERLGL